MKENHDIADQSVLIGQGLIGVVEATDDITCGDAVVLNSGGPPMAVVEITLTSPGPVAVVAWWRAEDGTPQIVEIDARCVHRAIPC